MTIRFNPGRCCATPAAVHELAVHYVLAEDLLNRHVNGDWGDLSYEDRLRNELALVEMERLMSCYSVEDGVKIYVVTEADRSTTTVMLDSEY